MWGVGLVLLYFGMAILAAALVLQQDRYVVRRSAKIGADARRIFRRINEADVLSAWAGEGEATIVESRPDELLVLRLDSGRPAKSESFVTFALRPEGAATVVDCALSGRNSYADKAKNLFGGREKALGPKVEKALADLAASFA
ncbi:hypothetical protein LG047_13580 [Methylocystis sp. WRRC1]|uniref:hypothetical protein n=1 Tax=Methylocystis sp. WRRC1 TaxID=1732014 RepID=UPI001D137367|nr:hypothetical protein [Methylocystis sp. WRRC1]MCC3246337.1 hypothetical protein [Methylocystis sp. WRRC1]